MRHYIQVRLNPDLTIVERAALVARLRAEAEPKVEVFRDCFGTLVRMEEVSAHGPVILIENINRDPDMVALPDDESGPSKLGYLIYLDDVLDTDGLYPTLRFQSDSDLALARAFRPWIGTDLSAQHQTYPTTDDGVQTLGQSEAELALATVYLLINEKILKIVPTWKGHKKLINPRRITPVT